VTCSRWQIAGLETYIVCNSNDRIAWSSPTGRQTSFEKPIPPAYRSFDDKGNQLMLVSQDEYVVMDSASREWTYKHGSLTSVRLNNGDIVIFRCENGLIREIKKDDKILFHVTQSGLSLILFNGDHRLAAIHYDAKGQLIDSIFVGDENSPPLEFSYEGNNLRSITVGKKHVFDFLWKKLDFWDKFSTTLEYPYYLYSDGIYKYQHSSRLGIAKMLATSRAGDKQEKTLNFKTGQITDKNYNN